MEQALIYLIEKQNTRLLYATDTGGIPALATRMSGIDAHQKGNPITALIMEATMGMEYDVDFRLFTHSSVALVERTVRILKETKRYLPLCISPTLLVPYTAHKQNWTFIFPNHSVLLMTDLKLYSIRIISTHFLKHNKITPYVKQKTYIFESKDVSFCRQIRKSYTKITNTCNVLQRL